MMNKKRLMAILAAGVLTATSFNPAMIKAESVSAEEAGMAVPADAAGMSVPADAAGAAVSADEAGAAVSADEAGAVVAGDGSETAVFSEDGTPVKKTVKAADINMKVQDSYDFPFLGLKAVLPEELKKQIENSDMLMITEEEWNDDSTGFKYAFFHWNKLTEEQKNEDVNLLGTGYEDWLKSIERVGTLGVYSKDVIDDLDSITGCNEHKELGTSEDGNYKYYLSINKDAESDLTDEIEKIETTITEMTAFDPSKSVFDMPAENANPDAGNVGAFETTDIDGNAYTEKVFSDYDLTLVNIFTTWCSPCVNEMPDLDKLYQEMKEKGVGVVGMVIDSVGEDGTTDEDTVKKAQILKEKTGVTYPLLIPDAGNMNGRISGLSSFPESFFVDKDGNIVGDPIMGSRNLEDWKTAVEDALEKINSEK